MTLSWPMLSLVLLACLGNSFVRDVESNCCINSCSGHGLCTSLGSGCFCNCFDGYTHADCSKRNCPQGLAWFDAATSIDTAHQLSECSNKGLCDYTTGTCACQEGFTGSACDRLACPIDCSGRGECRSMKFHATMKDRERGAIIPYETNWDSTLLHGCACEPGFSGPSCTERECPLGDDPLTGKATDTEFGQQFNEKQAIFCAATGGTFTLSFKGQTTVPIAFNEPAITLAAKLNALSTIREVDVRYAGMTITACTTTGNTITVEFIQDFGSQPILVADTSRLTHGISVQFSVSEMQDGTKENEACSNRGYCDTMTGYCTCYAGYTTSNGMGEAGDRGDCGSTAYPVTSCPGEIECSGHGYCAGAPYYRCYCVAGWTSGDCSQRTCPEGASWFDEPHTNNVAHAIAECSSMGICDRSKGECICANGFEGAACERMSCPGADSPCSGNGKCLTIAELAREAGFSYGATPNDPTKWDHNKIQGCKCDADYTGYDCSLLIKTLNEVVELG